MNCPKCGLINTGNLAVGLAMPQCMCQWQNTQEKCRIETVPAQGTLLPKREWVGLTDEEVMHCYMFWVVDLQDIIGFYKGVETKLKELNA